MSMPAGLMLWRDAFATMDCRGSAVEEAEDE